MKLLHTIPESFQVISADPAWLYKDKLRMADVARSAEDQYEQVMTVDDICALGTEDKIFHFNIRKTALLFLWVTNPFLLDGSGAKVCRYWGFYPKQIITWLKGDIRVGVDAQTGFEFPYVGGPLGMGHYTRGDTEHMILATRGNATKLIKQKNIRNWFIAPKREHSRKPEEAYQLIESLVDGPYLELFARHGRKNWTSYGNELDAEISKS